MNTDACTLDHLAELLLKRLQKFGLTPEGAENHARHLVVARSIAIGWTTVDTSDRAQRRDLDALEKCAKKLKGASQDLSSVGSFGGKGLVDSLNSLAKPDWLNAVPSSQLHATVAQDLSERLSEIGSLIDAAVDSLPKPRTRELEPQRRGGKENHLASSLSFVAARIWHDTSGQEPTVPRDAVGDGHQRYGEFLELIRDVFEAFDVNGKPESYCDKARDDFRDWLANQ